MGLKMYPDIYTPPTGSGYASAFSGYGSVDTQMGSPSLGYGMPDVVSQGLQAPLAPIPVSAPSPVSTVSPGGVDTSGVGGADAAAKGGFLSNLNFDKVGTILDGIGSIGKIYAAIQSNKIARDSLNFQKQSYATNLTNQIKSYNLGLEDRIRARAAQHGTGASEADAYIAKHRLG